MPTPSSPPESRPRIAIVGGGISGLAAAHRLTELLPHAELALFEAADRLGGVIRTVRRDGCLVEQAADSFITKTPWAVDLCRRIGMADELLSTSAANRRAFVVRNGKLLPVPEGFVLMTPRRLWPLVTTPVLSWRGKLRLLAEPLVPDRRPIPDSKADAVEPADESVASFATRRLGREAFERHRAAAVGRNLHGRSGEAEHGRHIAGYRRAAASIWKPDPCRAQAGEER